MANHPKLAGYFADYASFHKTSGNRLTHVFGIPIIVLAITGLLNKVIIYDTGFFIQGSPGVILFLGATIFYLVMSPTLGLATILTMLLLYCLGALLPTSVLVGLFIFGWALQYFGHFAYEKQAPAFYKNGLHLLIGPMFILKYYLTGATKQK